MKTNLVPASLATKLSKEAHDDKVKRAEDEIIQSVIDAINVSIGSGSNYYHTSRMKLPQRLKDLLIKEGYALSKPGDYYVVSWG